MQFPFDFEDTERSPRKVSMHDLTKMESSLPSVYRRVDISEIPLICRDLTVGLHIPLSSEQVELLLGEHGVNDC